ncbi:mechanosensitive ion channel family protein [Nitrosopumilus piranensis]|uniref:Putative MscS family protein n=1 Tax=Nitrosopumilus piranensis TaxID=1582439 RepID=A0A0C5BY49_9ARCH|nr:mechanosensitive ion channel family protein [Nitrosopumilus piranensis]AJM93246.1 putative MscS family protein [Nitrosopumilus piranensis]
MVLEILDTQLTDGLTIWSLLVIGIIVFAGVIVARIARMIFNKKFAPTMSTHSVKTLNKLIYYGIIVIFLFAATASQGFDIGGLVVGAGFMGIVIGFAAQTVVSNMISGVFLLIEKPVKQGDTVEVVGDNVTGKLIDINTFSSKIQQFDGTVVRIPNEKMFTSNLRTFDLSEVRRSEVTVGIGYGEDIDKAIKTIKNAIEKNVVYSLMEPAPHFSVSELADNSVNILVRVWHPRDDLLEVMPTLLKVIKNALDAEGIEIPFPQRVVWDGKGT